MTTNESEIDTLARARKSDAPTMQALVGLIDGLREELKRSRESSERHHLAIKALESTIDGIENVCKDALWTRAFYSDPNLLMDGIRSAIKARPNVRDILADPKYQQRR